MVSMAVDEDMNPEMDAPRGHSGLLRFREPLEAEFQEVYINGLRTRLHLVTSASSWLLVAFIIGHILVFSSQVWIWSVLMMGLGLLPCLLLVRRFSQYMPTQALYRLIVMAAMVAAASVPAIILVARAQHEYMPYEGMLVITLFIYFLSGLLVWHAMLVSGFSLLLFLLVELAYSNLQGLLIHMFFVIALNFLGLVGAFLLERATRNGFLMMRMLNDLAERDALTGLFNRRAFSAHMARVWRQSRRDHASLAVAMVDVDYFKRFNDTYGHAAGDQALRKVSKALGGCARRALDMAARFGGEEFVMIWYDPASAEDVLRMSEQLRKQVQGLRIPHEGSSVATEVTASVGVAVMPPDFDGELETLLHTADEALYRAKEAGRNRVELVTLPQAAGCDAQAL